MRGCSSPLSWLEYLVAASRLPLPKALGFVVLGVVQFRFIMNTETFFRSLRGCGSVFGCDFVQGVSVKL